MINCVLVKMLQDDPSEDSGNPEPDSGPAFQCPDCLQTFKRKHSLERHITLTLKIMFTLRINNLTHHKNIWSYNRIIEF